MVSDPLQNLQGQEEMLFRMFTQFAAGKNVEAVMGAAVNMLINSIRQNYATRDAAEHKMSELLGRAMQMLLANHYDSVTGRRRSVFPHDQIVRMAYHMEDDIHDPRLKRNGR